MRQSKPTSLFAVACLAMSCCAGGGGCASDTGVSTRSLLASRALIDFTGLGSIERMDRVQVTAAVPIGWKRSTPKNGLLYTHDQWKSPSGHTGVGVAYVKTPFPVSAGLIAWLARQEYGKKAADGKVISEWTDAAGRRWFEAENAKFHVRGSITTRGCEAWIVYSGYRLTAAPDPAEIALAVRSANTYVPVAGVEQPPRD